MNADIIFLAGLLVLGLSLPLTLAAFSTSGKTFRPVVLCLIIGGSMVLLAIALNPGSYSANDIPRIIGDLLG